METIRIAKKVTLPKQPRFDVYGRRELRILGSTLNFSGGSFDAKYAMNRNGRCLRQVEIAPQIAYIGRHRRVRRASPAPGGPEGEEPGLPDLPPPITESDFQNLEGATAEQVRRRAAPLVEGLHAYLNEGSCLKDIQSIRAPMDPHRRNRPAFGGDRPVKVRAAPEHWYTYNTGGRNEAQFNLGLYSDYLRVGMGFEFTKGARGDPERVQSMFGLFREELRRRREWFDGFARENELRVEWMPAGKAGRKNLRYEKTERVSKWLLKPRTPEWAFVGRLLMRNEDTEILGDPVRLKEAMESVFEGLKPMWVAVIAAGYGP